MVDRLARALFDMGRDVTARDVKGRTPSRPSSQVSSLLPPPPRLSISNVLDTATSQVNRAVATPPQQSQPQRLNIPTVTDRREEPDAWGVYETNYGPVAMPASWGEAGGYRQQGDLITDPQQLERAKNSNYAYTKLPEEQQKEIRMPVLEGRADNAVREATGSVTGGIAPFLQQEAKKQLDAASRIGSGAVTGGIEKALKIRDELPEREEPQDEQAFAVVRNNQTNSTHLVRREDLEAAPEGTFTVITPNVNAQEAQSMMDAGLLQEGEAPVIRGPEDLGEQVDSADLASRFGIESFRNRQATEATREAPPEQRTAEYTLGTPNDLPEPPEGYAWAVRIDSPANAQPGTTYPARLIPLVASPDGGWMVPENLGEGVMVVATPEGVAMPEAPRGPLDAALDVVNPIIEDPVGTIEAGISRLPGGEVLTNSTLPELIWGARYFIENVPVTGEPGGATLSDIGTNIDEWKIPGTDTTIGDFRSGIWNLDIPGTQATLGDVVTAFVNYVQVPGDDAINVISDSLYEQFTGNEVDTETTGGGALGRIPLIGGFLENMYESGLDNDVSQGAAEAILGKPYVDWATQNQDTYVDIYENGYDINGDGSVMITGADGVLTYWLNEEASAVEALYVLTFTDPLTIAGGIGAGGKWVARGGKIIRMGAQADPGVVARAQRIVGRGLEAVGTATHVVGRTGEALGDMGLEYVLWGITRGLEKTGIIAPSPGTRRTTDMTDAQESAGGAIRQDRVTEEGDTIVVDDTGRVVEVEGADGTSREVSTADRRTVSEGEFPVGTGPEQEYYNSRIIRTDDGWEVQVLTDDGGWVTRTKSKTLDNARKWETRYQQRATTASGGGRWERAPQGTDSPKFIDNIPPDQYDALRAAIGDQWAQSEDIMASIGRGTPLPEHALESSRIARVTIDTAEGIADGQPLPDWALNEAHYMNPHYEAMETAIRSAWSSPESMGARSLLDGSGSVRRADGLTVRSSSPVISSEALPRGRRRVSQKRIRAANNYVDMMHEHAKWHPESFRDGSFNEAWQRAVDLDYDLRQRGQRRSYNGVEREPLTAVRVPDGLMFTPEVQRGAARVTNEPGPSPQRAAEPEGETWTIEDPDNPRNNGRGYRITEDIWIEVTPVNASDVPTQWLRTYPDHRGRWYAAIVKGDNHTADNLIVTYAPTEAEALALARETLRSRGLIPGESGGLDVVADVNRASGDVVRMRQGPEQPRPHLTSRGLPKAGESREWNGIPVRAVEIDGETVYIFDTNDGPFAIRRENGKAVAVDPAAATEGRIVELTWDGGRAINMRDAGRHIFRMHEQAATPDVPAGDAVRAADAPETVDTTPDTTVDREAVQRTYDEVYEREASAPVEGGALARQRAKAEAKRTALSEALELQVEQATRSWTPEMWDSLRQYQRGSHINEELRLGDVFPNTQKVIDDLDAMMTFELPEGALLYRGQYNGARYADIAVGDEMPIDPAYLSTSLNPEIAREYSTKNLRLVNETRPVVMELTAGPDARGLLVDESQRRAAFRWDQAEFILPRGTRIRVDQIMRPSSRDTIIRGTIIETPTTRRLETAPRPEEIAPTPDATPDTPAPAEATTAAPRPRMTPETRRQRVQRIRSSRKRQMREVRQSREAVVNARIRALYGEVTPEGGLRADVLAPPVRRFDPPEATATDPSGTFEMPRTETPDPEARPSWADPDVPAMSPEGQRAVMRGAQGKGSGRMPDSPDRSRGGPHRIKQKITAARGQGERLSWNTNHFIQEQDGRAFWMKRPVTDDQVEALTRHTFRDGGDGDTLMERISIRSERYAANDNYRQDMTVYEYRALQDSLADYEKLLAEVHQNPLARRTRKVVGALPEPARKSLEAVGRVLRAMLGAWDSYINYARESMLFSHLRFLAYPSLQFFGNFGQIFLGGRFMEAIRGANPRTWLEYRGRILRSAKSVDDMIMLDPGASPYLKLQVELNMRPAREVREIYEGMFGSINDPLEVEKWLKKLNVPGATKIARLKGSKIHAVHGAMIDAAFRDSVAYTSTMRLLRNEAVPDFRNMTQVRLMEWGFSRDEARRLWREFTDSYDRTVFNANDVRRFFGEHVDEGRAVRLQRDWQGALNKVDKMAREDIKKYTFASPRTNADEFMGRVFIFHHFMTRQSNYYANLVARHPAMLNLYFNVKEQLENEDWPEFLNGWVPWFEAFGRQFFVNPTYALSSYLFFNDYGSTFEEEGQTRLGGALKWWDEKIGLSPAIMQAGNLFGLFGEDYAPNPLFMRRETNVLTTAINFGRAHGLLGDDPTPVGNVEEQFWLNVRERVSGILPGTEQVDAIDVEARMDREVNMLIVDELQREDPDFDINTPEGQERFNEVASDPDSPIYQRAVKRWVNGEVLEEALRIGIATFQPRNRPVNEEGEDLYHSFGRDVKSLVNTTDPRARELNLQADRYYDIGTERDREIAGLWNQVAFGHVHHPITVDGVTYSPAEIYHMNTEQRIALADGLLQEHGLLDDYKELQDERDRFLAQPENAEYAQFYTWRKEVNDYDGGVEKYWQDAIDGGNESARLYYEDVMSQPLTYEQRHQRLTSMYGFMQLKGYHTSVWDPAPVQMHGVFDPVNVANQAPQPIPYEEPNAEFRNEVRKAPEQLAELQEWDNKVKQVQSEMGIDPSIPFNELDTQTRIAIEEELEARGHSEPSLSWQVKKYVEWAEQQPPGADTSIEAFFEASDREYREGAPGRVQEKMNKPEPAPGPDRYGNQPTSSPSLWAEIDALLREHDHRYKPDDSSSSGGSGSSSSGHWLLPYIN